MRRRLRFSAPQALGELALQALSRPEEVRLAQVCRWWCAEVPRRVRQAARPLRLEGDTLWLEVKHSVWASELLLLSPDLCASARRYLRTPPFTSLRTRVAQGGWHRLPEPAHVPMRKAPSLAPLPPAVAEAFSRIHDPALRALLDETARYSLL